MQDDDISFAHINVNLFILNELDMWSRDLKLVWWLLVWRGEVNQECWIWEIWK